METERLGNSCSVGALVQVSCTHATSSVEASLSCRSPCGHNANAPPSACRHSTSVVLSGEAGAAIPKLVHGWERKTELFGQLLSSCRPIREQLIFRIIVPDFHQVYVSGRQPALDRAIPSKVSAV